MTTNDARTHHLLLEISSNSRDIPPRRLQPNFPFRAGLFRAALSLSVAITHNRVIRLSSRPGYSLSCQRQVDPGLVLTLWFTYYIWYTMYQEEHSLPWSVTACAANDLWFWDQEDEGCIEEFAKALPLESFPETVSLRSLPGT
ncbi:hypothetical protein B0H13DRAFT_1924373 [Mycena leptocephala]|nr:hypothetical protein B0H13DRAFT_1924373 [Mycena leptocephala]